MKIVSIKFILSTFLSYFSHLSSLNSMQCKKNISRVECGRHILDTNSLWLYFLDFSNLLQYLNFHCRLWHAQIFTRVYYGLVLILIPKFVLRKFIKLLKLVIQQQQTMRHPRHMRHIQYYLLSEISTGVYRKANNSCYSTYIQVMNIHNQSSQNEHLL